MKWQYIHQLKYVINIYSWFFDACWDCWALPQIKDVWLVYKFFGHFFFVLFLTLPYIGNRRIFTNRKDIGIDGTSRTLSMAKLCEKGVGESSICKSSWKSPRGRPHGNWKRRSVYLASALCLSRVERYRYTQLKIRFNDLWSPWPTDRDSSRSFEKDAIRNLAKSGRL